MSIGVDIQTHVIEVEMQSIGTSWWTVIVNNDNFLGFLDVTTNIATKNTTTINPAVVSAAAPTPAQWYYVVSVGWDLWIDLVWEVGVGQIVLFESSLWRATNDPNAALQAHIGDTSNPHQVTKAQVWLGNADNTSDANKPISITTQIALSNKADLVGWLVPSSQLPGFVDDVVEFSNLASFPVIWEHWKIYVALDTLKTYRWSWSVYAQLSESQRWAITGTLSNQTDLQNALNLKVNNQASSSASTTISFLVDVIHWSYWSPILWNLTANLTGAVRWVCCTVFHNSLTVPTITWATKHSWLYRTSALNIIQFLYDWNIVFYTINPTDA